MFYPLLLNLSRIKHRNRSFTSEPGQSLKKLLTAHAILLLINAPIDFKSNTPQTPTKSFSFTATEDAHRVLLHNKTRPRLSIEWGSSTKQPKINVVFDIYQTLPQWRRRPRQSVLPCAVCIFGEQDNIMTLWRQIHPPPKVKYEFLSRLSSSGPARHIPHSRALSLSLSLRWIAGSHSHAEQEHSRTNRTRENTTVRLRSSILCSFTTTVQGSWRGRSLSTQILFNERERRTPFPFFGQYSASTLWMVGISLSVAYWLQETENQRATRIYYVGSTK